VLVAVAVDDVVGLASPKTSPCDVEV